MRSNSGLETICYTDAQDENQAIRDISNGIDLANTAIIFLFVNSSYDLDILAQAMNAFDDVPVMGCTTAGSINAGAFKDEGITAVALPSQLFYATIANFENLSELEANQIANTAQRALTTVNSFIHSDENFRWSKFCVQLIDGTTGQEEKFTEHISQTLSYIPYIGGSAGDKLRFKKSFVYTNHQFQTNAAAVAFCATTLQVKPFFHQHFDASPDYLIVTSSDTDNRNIKTINGLPASEEYARHIGVSVNDLSPEVFSLYPLIVQVGGDNYIRSIQRANEDGSLTFYCSISRGIILKVAKTKDITISLDEAMKTMTREMGDINFILGFNCILRYLEILEGDKIQDIEMIHRAINLSGFNSYGEQFQSTHINQTFTGLAFGGEHTE
ncbi:MULTISPECIES: FIST N-terminal domain-containing protein [unclassified Neptuniibacter]|uniref:FIST N-terminal domain-containing protein n=1 Tax=unclassified Neptuniibacter TaxID=2630693 RepID=UPI000C454B5D|nr:MULTISPECIES: FIST N-terminal domain-containing protein [unclassified Neptuniibacter]MAY43341.1 hypothetical protein [Oceanospirillaceae bacterium]|tara:strand:- start:3739 stop:4893 length:1155 start_codon:yes stop_codon:yes gene_type:complete